jgi:hypothetical protein
MGACLQIPDSFRNKSGISAHPCIILYIPIVQRHIFYFSLQLLKSRIFCMLRNTRSKLMNILLHLVITIYSKFLFLDTFLKRQTNVKNMFSALSVK